MATLKNSRTVAFTIILFLLGVQLQGITGRVSTVATAQSLKTVATTHPSDVGTTVSSRGAYPAWRNFVTHSQVTAMAAEGNYMWLGTSDNVEEMDINSGAIVVAYTHADGLPLGTITAIAVEPNGTKWFAFGFDNTVARFDDKSWQTFTPSNSGLLQGSITAIAIDNAGNKWFTLSSLATFGNEPSYGGGLAEFDNSHWFTYTTANSPLPSNNLTSIAIDNAGNKWISATPDYDSNSQQSVGGGLAEFNGTIWQIYNTSNSQLPTNTVFAVAVDKSSNKWVVTKNYNASTSTEFLSLSKFDGTHWSNWQVPNNNFTIASAISLIIDDAGNKWISCYFIIGHSASYIPYRFDGTNWQSYPNNGPTLALDKSGSIWANSGIYLQLVKISGTNVQYFSTALPSLPPFNGEVSGVAIDKSGHEWFSQAFAYNTYPYGTYFSGGAVEFDGNNWTSFPITNDQETVSLTFDTNNSLWALNSGFGVFNLSNLTNGVWKDYPLPFSDSSTGYGYLYTVNSLAIDSSNNKWVGSNQGVFVFNNSSWITYTFTTIGLPQATVAQKIYVDNANNKWVGTDAGVSKFDGTNWITYTTANSGLLTNTVSSMVQDSKGNMWFGSPAVYNHSIGQFISAGGISKLTGTTWVTYTTSNSGIATGSVNALTADKNGNLWVGLNSGLSRFDGNTWQNYTSDNSGLYSNNVNAFTSDSNGNLWVGDNNAVSELLNLPAYTYSYPLPSLSNNANGFTSYLAVQNANASQTDLALQYYDANGNYFNQSLDNCVGLSAQAECLPSNVFVIGNKGTGVVLSTQPLNIIVAEATPAGGSAYAPSGGASSSLIAPLAIKGYLGFATQLTVFNTSSTASNVSVQYYSQDGSFQNSATQTVSIPAYSSYVFDQSTNNNLPSGFYGWTQITGEAGSQLAGQVLEQNSASHFVAIATMAAKGASTLYAPAIFNNAYGGFVTGANIVNPNNSPAQATLTFYDHNGAVANTIQLNLQAHAITPLYQGDVNSGLPSGFYGSAVLSSTYNSLPLVMVVNEGGSVTQAGNAQSGTYSAVASGSQAVALPVMANNGFGYTTGTTILNTSNSSVSGTIQYFNLDGTAIGTAQPFTIAANASQPFYQGAAGLPANFYGTAVVTQTSGTTNSLVVTTNAQSLAFFYTYTEPS